MRIVLKIRVVLLATVFGFFWSVANAQDSFELGKVEGGAVRIAIWLDHYYATCRKDHMPKFWNLTSTMLGACPGGSKSPGAVLAQTASATGTTVDYLRKLATNEVDQKIMEFGGCGSKSMTAWIAQAKQWHANHIEELNNLCRAKAYFR